MYEALLEFPEGWGVLVPVTWESAYDMGDVSRSSTVLVQLAECVSISFLSGTLQILQHGQLVHEK